MENIQTYVIGKLPGVADDASLLVKAVRDGNQDIIEQILQTGVDINEPQSSGETPIVESKNGAVAQFLISRGADVNRVTNSTMRTPLMYVLGRLSEYEYTHNSKDCLKEVILVLLKNGACVNARTSNGRTPLMLAAAVCGQVEVLQMLVDHGADCTDRDNKGNTALMHTLNPDSADFLLQLNTDLLNAQNNLGLTALMCSLFYCYWDTAFQLIDKGADVNITDVNGNTALFHAISSHLPETVLEDLIRSGCSVNHQNNAGLSPLMYTVRRCNYNGTVPLLLDLGADVNAINRKDTSKTALTYFKKNLHKEAIATLETLLDYGANAAYLSPYVLFTVISTYPYKLIPKLIRCGLAPFDYSFDEIPLWHQDIVITLTSASPLSLALLTRNATLARYFWDNLFLITSDLSLASNNNVRKFLQETGCEECVSFLDEKRSRPMSLLRMCFVAVSSAIGASPGREARVHELPLPSLLKERLLFKSEVVNLVQPEGRYGNPSIRGFDQFDDDFLDQYPEDIEYFGGLEYSD